MKNLEDTEVEKVEKKELKKVKNNKFHFFIEKIKKFCEKVNMRKMMLIALFFFSCVVSMELLNGICRISIYGKRMLIEKFLFNFILLIAMYLMFYFITHKTKLSCTLVSVIVILFSIANYIVIEVRGIAITISDFFVINTALNVIKGTRIQIRTEFVIGIILFIVSNIILWKYIDFKEKNRKNRYRVLGGVVAILILVVTANSKYIAKMNIWDINDSYIVNGAGPVMLKMASSIKVKQPANYNSNDISLFLDNYEDETKEYDGQNLPNVVVIMNESFADLNDVYDLQIQEDNLPFYHSLIGQENTVSGIMHSSKFGGGTANVEYEFLTQNTTAFLPVGSYPYQQYITKAVKESIISYMNNLNYNSYGMHPWYKKGYSREKVYKFLGFKNTLFYEDMDELKLDKSDYVSDESAYEYIYKTFENKQKDEKIFDFLVTVQNHTPFWNEDTEGKIFKDGDQRINTYFQEIYRSDMALENLIQFFKGYDEDTIILFFGDHQPEIDIDESYTINSKYDNEEAKYIIPFFIWANYDIEEQKDIETSTNYLQNILLNAANMPKNQYDNYIDELRTEIPVITANYYKDKDGQRYNFYDTDSPYYEKLQEYWKVIYYEMFNN